MKDRNLSVEVTCQPTTTATHNIYVAHEFYQKVSFDSDGKATLKY